MDIRATTEADRPALVELYRDAFPAEDLVPLLHRLLDAGALVHSFAAIVDGALAGHIALTRCAVSDSVASAWLLGPLAVAPLHQRKGIGSALIAHCVRLAESEGSVRVLVLGDPAYYGRHGFEAERDITPPYALPAEWDGAWQSISLGASGEPIHGELVVPEVWRREELWLP